MEKTWPSVTRVGYNLSLLSCAKFLPVVTVLLKLEIIHSWWSEKLSKRRIDKSIMVLVKGYIKDDLIYTMHYESSISPIYTMIWQKPSTTNMLLAKYSVNNMLLLGAVVSQEWTLVFKAVTGGMFIMP